MCSICSAPVSLPFDMPVECYGKARSIGGLMQCLAYWNKIKGAERWGPEWSLQALAAAQRVQLSLSAFADNIYSLVQPHAESFK